MRVKQPWNIRKKEKEMETKEWVLNPEIPHQRFFEEMTRIPHGSYHEKAYGDYLENFARKHNFEYRRDEIGNVVMYKPASKGYETHPYVAIQAHMDMVWAKEPDCDHDFEKEPLKLYKKDGYLRAKGTTLGADDGTGVAYILALLDNKDAQHPPIEAIFTVQEEVGLNGAKALKREEIRSRQLISLDCGGGDSIYISSLGGFRGKAEKTFAMEKAEGNAFTVTVDGLKGGYSSGYMEEQRNAIDLTARILEYLNQHGGIRLVSLTGGVEDSKIATTCRAVLTSRMPEEKLKAGLEKIAADIKKEAGPAEPGLMIRSEKTSTEQQMTQKDSDEIISLLFLLPCGFRHRHSTFSEIMSESVNWIFAETGEDTFTLTYALRGSTDSMVEHMQEEIRLMAETFGASAEEISSFPAWEFHDSRLLHTLQKVFRESEGKELGLIPVQGGLECGVFAHMYEDMDIIAMGPYGYDVHTPEEHMDLANFDSLYLVFEKLLAAL